MPGRTIVWSANRHALTTITAAENGARTAARCDLSTGQITDSRPLPTPGNTSSGFGSYCEISPDGSRIAYGEAGYGSPSELQYVNIATREIKSFSVAGAHAWIRPVAFSADSTLMAITTVGPDTKPAVDLYRTHDLERLASIPDMQPPLAFAPNGKHLAASDAQNRVCLIDCGSGEVTARLESHTFAVSCLAFSNDGRWLASVSNGANSYEDKRPTEIRLFDLALRERVRQWNMPSVNLAQLWFDGGGQWLCSSDAMIGGGFCWAVASPSGSPPRVTLHPPVISGDGSLHATQGGKPMSLLLAVIWENPTIQIIDSASGAIRTELKSIWPEAASLRPVAFSPDGHDIAVQVTYRSFLSQIVPMSTMSRWGASLVTHEVWVVDLATGRCKYRIPGFAPQGIGGSSMFLPDHRTVLTLDSRSLAANAWSLPPRRPILISLLIGVIAVLPLAIVYRNACRVAAGKVSCRKTTSPSSIVNNTLIR